MADDLAALGDVNAVAVAGGALRFKEAPASSNSQGEARMKHRSMYGLYNTITRGVGGTSMRAFSELNEGDRWALAFLAAGLRAQPDDTARGEAGVLTLTPAPFASLPLLGIHRPYRG